MMDEELHLQLVQIAGIFRGAVVITVAALVGHLCAASGLQRDRPAVRPEPRRDLTAAPVRVARVS